MQSQEAMHPREQCSHIAPQRFVALACCHCCTARSTRAVCGCVALPQGVLQGSSAVARQRGQLLPCAKMDNSREIGSLLMRLPFVRCCSVPPLSGHRPTDAIGFGENLVSGFC